MGAIRKSIARSCIPNFNLTEAASSYAKITFFSLAMAWLVDFFSQDDDGGGSPLLIGVLLICVVYIPVFFVSVVVVTFIFRFLFACLVLFFGVQNNVINNYRLNVMAASVVILPLVAIFSAIINMIIALVVTLLYTGALIACAIVLPESINFEPVLAEIGNFLLAVGTPETVTFLNQGKMEYFFLWSYYLTLDEGFFIFACQLVYHIFVSGLLFLMLLAPFSNFEIYGINLQTDSRRDIGDFRPPFFSIPNEEYLSKFD